MFKTFISDESGATAIEYAMIVGLPSIVIIAALRVLGPVMKVFISYISSSIMYSMPTGPWHT